MQRCLLSHRHVEGLDCSAAKIIMEACATVIPRLNLPYACPLLRRKVRISELIPKHLGLKDRARDLRSNNLPFHNHPAGRIIGRTNWSVKPSLRAALISHTKNPASLEQQQARGIRSELFSMTALRQIVRWQSHKTLFPGLRACARGTNLGPLQIRSTFGVRAGKIWPTSDFGWYCTGCSESIGYFSTICVVCTQAKDARWREIYDKQRVHVGIWGGKNEHRSEAMSCSRQRTISLSGSWSRRSSGMELPRRWEPVVLSTIYAGYSPRRILLRIYRSAADVNVASAAGHAANCQQIKWSEGRTLAFEFASRGLMGVYTLGLG